MISKNSHLNKNFSFPFLLKPVGKDYLWGGNKLNTEFGKGIDMKPLAETWECSTHPDGISQIASGEYKVSNAAHVFAPTTPSGVKLLLI